MSLVLFASGLMALAVLILGGHETKTQANLYIGAGLWYALVGVLLALDGLVGWFMVVLWFVLAVLHVWRGFRTHRALTKARAVV